MSSQEGSNNSSAFVKTFQNASKKVNCQTIKERSRESFQLIKEKVMAIDWREVGAQMKNFNLELFKPFQVVTSSCTPACMQHGVSVRGLHRLR
jgi:hypothetical protein